MGFSKKNCVLSKKQILKNSKYGELLACATKNVLIHPNMKVATDPSVYQKKAREEDMLELLEVDEEYGFEMPGADPKIVKEFMPKAPKEHSQVPASDSAKQNQAEQNDAETDEKNDKEQQKKKDEFVDTLKKQKDANKMKSSAPSAEPIVVRDAVAKKWRGKLKAAEEEAATCQRQLKQLQDGQAAASGKDGEIAKLKKVADDANAKAAAADANAQEKIKTAVDAAKAKEMQETENALKKQKDQMKAEENAKVTAEVNAKTGAEKKTAEAKLAKGAKDEAIAKEALKQAMNLSDAEKAEMAQNKKLAADVGKLKTKALLEKKEKEAFQGELKESKVVDKARIQKQKNKVEALETQEIEDSAKKAEAQEDDKDSQGQKKMLIEAAQHMAIGMSL